MTANEEIDAGDPIVTYLTAVVGLERWEKHGKRRIYLFPFGGGRDAGRNMRLGRMVYPDASKTLIRNLDPAAYYDIDGERFVGDNRGSARNFFHHLRETIDRSGRLWSQHGDITVEEA